MRDIEKRLAEEQEGRRSGHLDREIFSAAKQVSCLAARGFEGKVAEKRQKERRKEGTGGYYFIFPFVSLCSVLFCHSPALGISSRCISICISLPEETGHQMDPSSTSRHLTLFSTSRFFPFSTQFYFLLKFSQFCWSFAFVMEDGSLVVCERSLFYFF